MNTLKLILFYILSFIWGVIMTVLGGLISLVLLITGHKPHRYSYMIYFNVGKDWGGVSFGPFFFCDDHTSESTKRHESGHAIQNAVLGPLFIAVVAIPSSIRYWLRRFKSITSKITYSLILGLVLYSLVITVMVLIPTTIYSLLIIVIILYITVLLVWLLAIEIPKYELGSVPYDSIWFEGQATKLGNKYCK